MIWGVIGVVVVLAALWAVERRGFRRTETRMPLPPDPFVDRRSMVRYHAALRQKRR